ncbi:uncharacterized protein LOC113429154 [Notechis scutatus]|uniref:Uncharacterized protein LOC113429154 n=1 Tax=Notechis scutatus TaxID=8663 RepID=A0A6J1VWI7_9SAUR|nr:uncharacterized protein LOC113429154 [Notechis scutatus]
MEEGAEQHGTQRRSGKRPCPQYFSGVPLAQNNGRTASTAIRQRGLHRFVVEFMGILGARRRTRRSAKTARGDVGKSGDVGRGFSPSQRKGPSGSPPRMDSQRFCTVRSAAAPEGFWRAEGAPSYRQMQQILLTPKDYHEQLFQKISRSHLGEAASGVLLIYSQSILHILEASSGTLYHILMDLALFEHQGAAALLRDIKIMVMSHNIPTRLFSQWNATKLEVPVTLEDVTQSQTTEEVITECLTLILKMGVYLATLKMGNKDLSECLHTAVPELLIPAETIQYLCRSQECLSPAEFLKMYKKPLQPQMDSGSSSAQRGAPPRWTRQSPAQKESLPPRPGSKAAPGRQEASTGLHWDQASHHFARKL